MRCPNYRLFCPSALHLSHGEVCERCLGGKEYWCLLRNCERDLLKSAGYALRSWAARVTRRILDNVDIFIVLSEFQRQRFIAQGIPPERIEILHNVTPSVGVQRTEDGRQRTEDWSPRTEHSDVDLIIVKDLKQSAVRELTDILKAWRPIRWRGNSMPFELLIETPASHERRASQRGSFYAEAVRSGLRLA